jgi:sugar (pentulose or hexulose) kinase
MNAAVIGVDIGSTSMKAVLMGADGVVRAVESRAIGEASASVPGAHELDPVSILDGVRDMLRALTAARGGVVVRALAFTGQMHGGLLVDPVYEPLTPFATWQDKRVDAGALPADVHPGFLAATAGWWLAHGLAPLPPGWWLAGIYEWVAGSLLGTPLAVDPGSAAAWGAYSPVRRAWCVDALHALGLSAARWPRLVPSGRVVGTVSAAAAAELGLSGDCVLVSGAGDTQASYIGSGCAADEVLINFGTGSQLMWESGEARVWPMSDVRYLFEERWLVTIATMCGGKSYALLADVLGAYSGAARDDVYGWMNERAGEAAPGSGGVTIEPLFNGSRYRGDQLRASMSGLSSSNFTTANLCRAMLEGMVEELAAPYFAVPAEARRHRGLVGSGNGLQRNAVLQQIIASRFGLPLRMSAQQEEAAVGAARLARMGLSG